MEWIIVSLLTVILVMMVFLFWRASGLSNIVGSNLSQTTSSMQVQLEQSRSLIADVTRKLESIENTNKQVVSYSEQLKSLQEVLQNPKHRGVLGEVILQNVLENVLKGQFSMQYAFKNGDRVDAVIRVKDKVIPIDSKFSMENFKRYLETSDKDKRSDLEKSIAQDLKNRINETRKYVRPDEGTTDFAFMFIPSEGLYYHILDSSVGQGESALSLVDYAFRNKVIMVSPTLFLAYLQTVLQGLKALEFEESAKEIRHNVEILGRHITKYDECYNKLGKSLGATVGHYNIGYKELGKINKDVTKTVGNGSHIQEIEQLEIERPVIEH